MTGRTAGAKPDLMRLAADERGDLAEFLDTLEPDQWDAPSLCAGWSVHDVVAHVVSYDNMSPGAMIGRRIKGLGRGGPNEVGRAQFAAHSPQELTALLRAHPTPTGPGAWFGGAVGLTDGLIHQQDIRRALNLPRTVPGDRVEPALKFALRSPKLPSRKHIRGLHLVASDLDWQHGTGPDVTGPAEALLMAVAGRPDALTDLSGAGVADLARRIGT